MLIKVKHMSSTNQNKSIHWFNLNAVMNRVVGNDKPNTDRIKPASELENIDFLPSAGDNDNFLYDLIPLVARVIADRIPAFSKFRNAVVRHIPHQYSDLMKEKSMQVPLGLLFKNENKNEEMIDIMQEIHDKYVPTAKPSDNESGEEMFVDVLEKLFFVGDQLSFERGTNSTDARCDGDTEFERLEALIPAVADWHFGRLLYQINYDVLYKGNSANDVGTMSSNMNIINNVNAKTNNVLDNFNSCKEFTNIETDALIVSAALKYFGMDSMNVEEGEVIPPQVLKSSKSERRIWLHKHSKKMIEEFVMKEQEMKHREIREGVQAATQPPQRGELHCQFCGKEYRYRKALANHITRQHGDEETGQPNEIVHTMTSQKPANSPTETISDDRYNYACVRLGTGLMLRNFDDAVKEGDGERIVRCWKMALLNFRAYGHTKYAMAAFLFQVATESTLTPRQAHCLIWNRTVNNKGGLGRNISLDLRLEHLNNLTKGMLKHLGPNMTEKTARRCSQSVSKIEQLLEAVDNDLKIGKLSGHHKTRKSENDFHTLVQELHERAKVFHFNPTADRQYQHFRNINNSILACVDHRLLNNWLTRHIRELSRLE